MSLSHDYRTLTPAERSLWRHPMMWLSAAAIAAVPLLYSTVYLGSSLDPYGNLKDLPVGLVNLDAGTTVRGKTYDLGAETVRTLTENAKFRYITYPSEAAAQDAVRRGQAYFALTIPKDFSRQAISGNSAQQGRLNFYVSEGTNYFASRVASNFATTLSDELNRSLGENRWAVVQRSLNDVQRGFADLRTATGQLRDGAVKLQAGSGELAGGAGDLAAGAERAAVGSQQLASGATTLSGGVKRLTDGTTRLSAGLRQLEAAAPGQKELAPLQAGALKLGAGAGELAGGLTRLSAGAGQLAAGARTVNSGAQGLASGNRQLAGQLPQLQSGLGGLSAGAAQLSEGAKAANAGAAQVAQGSRQLATQLPGLQSGLGQLSDSAAQLADGAKAATAGAEQLAEGHRQLATQLPALQSGLAPLSAGAADLAAGTAKLEVGATALAARLKEAQAGSGAAVEGAQKLSAGAAELAEGTAKLDTGAATLAAKLNEAQTASAAAVTGAQKLSAGATQLATGTAQLQTGSATLAANTAQAAKGAASLATGAKDLQDGVDRLVAGNLKMGAALGQITSQLPAQDDLSALRGGAATLATKSGELRDGLGTLAAGAGRLQQGAGELNAGAGKLADGLNTLYKKIPSDIEQLGGDPAGLSASVKPVIQTFAPTRNNGAAFAPYFMALSLWVGVTLTTFIFPYQQLPHSGRRTSQWARMLRKAAAPALLVVLQALLVVWGVHALGVEFLHPAEVVATAVASSLTFLALVLAMIFLFGAAGRLLALIALVVQLAASGGSYPVELGPRFFQLIHNWMPVTQSVNALRHGLFGAYQGEYLRLMLYLLSMVVVSVGLGLLGKRRWEFVDDEDFKPLISAPIVSQEAHHEEPAKL